jgi:hypothetical protein
MINDVETSSTSNTSSSTSIDNSNEKQLQQNFNRPLRWFKLRNSNFDICN